MTRNAEDGARWLADKLASQDKKIASLQTRGELAYSSIEDGAIVEKDLEGNLVASVGKQHDGSHVAVPYTGPIPAAPVAASLKAVPGVVEVRWSGKFTGDAVSAMDFKHVSVHVSTTPAVDATPNTQVATIRGELGDVATVTAVEGMLYVVLVAWSTAGKASAPSPVAAVAVPGAVDEAWLQNELDDINTRYDGVITDAGNLGTRLTTAEGELVEHEGRLSATDASLTTLTGTTLPALNADLAAAKARLTTAEGTLDPLPAALTAAQDDLTLLKNTTVPALGADLTAAKARLTTAEGTLATNQTAINTTLPGSIAAAKAAADMALLIAPVSTATPVLADGTGRPIGAIWTRIDGSGNEIGYWRWTASGWVTQALTTTVIPNLAASKITSGTIAAARIDTAALAVQLALIIELNADRITAGTITSAQVDTTNLAAALATILSLNADRITAGTINTARLNVSELAVQIATVIQLNASAITAGTIATARLNVTDLAANLATILSLNADRITAGTINVARLNTTAIAAATAAIQTVDVKNLFATTGTLSEAVITKLWADVVNSRKITTQMLAVGAFDNLIPDPDFTNTGLEWGAMSGVYSITNEGRLGGKSLRIAASASQSGKYSARIPSAGAASYLVTVWVKSNLAIPAGGIGIYTNTKLSASSGMGGANQRLRQAGGAAGNDPIPANTWKQLSCVADFADNVYDFAVGLYVQTLFSTGVVLFSEPSMNRMNAGELTVDGTVKAQQLEAQMVLVNDIIAGNPLGTHAKLNANGIRVMASTDGSAPTEVVRLGTDTDDYIGVVDPATGNLSAAINSTGNISGQTGDFASDVTLAGTSLLEMLNGIPRGVVAWASRATDAKYFAGYNVLPYLHLKFDVVPGRAYMVSTTPLTHLSDTANTDALAYLHYRTDGGTATVADTIISRVQTNAGPTSVGNRGAGTINRLITPTTPVVSLLLSYTCRTNVGRCKLVANAATSVILTVTDMGLAVPETGEYRDGTSDAAAGGTGGGEATPPTPVKTYEQTFNTTGTRSFVGGGGTYAYNTGYMYSGLSPSGYGDLSSMAVFPSFTSMLSGATIHDIWAYVYYDFWYQGSGGTAVISLHGQSALTSTKPSISGAVTVPGWPRAAGKWVRLPDSVYAGFKSGAWKGLALGGGGGGYERYGYAHDLKLKFKYTK